MKIHDVLIRGVVDILCEIIIERVYADKAIEKRFRLNKQWGARDRSFISSSVYNIIRYLRFYESIACINSIDSQRDRIHRITAAYLWERYQSVPVSLQVDSGLIEKFSENHKKALENERIRESYPDWLWDIVSDQYPEAYLEILKSLNQPAQVVLRINTLKTDKMAVQNELKSAQIAYIDVSDSDALILEERANVFGLPMFKKGWFEVQDLASQQVVPFLDVSPGMFVVDACAGAGGKTLHMASNMRNKGRILALDVEPYKLAELKKRAKRAGVANVEIRLFENTKSIKRLYNKADRVLIDAPCSGTGTLRRNPDAKWKLQPGKLSELLQIQKNILELYSRMVKPGGILVYATCSILPSENEDQIAAFLSQYPDFVLERERLLLPHQFGYDGFYMAKMIRAV